jgi:exopolysaccharide biosynthesis WecB/TagA/CpsF family protein
MALGLVLLLAGLPAAAAGAYLVVLALASLRRPPAPAVIAADHAAPRLAVIVPARDEEALIGRCVASLRAQSYPRDRLRVVVIADNCSDETAAVARAAAAEVLERSNEDAMGKGHALRWAMSKVLADASPPDAVVVVDADSVAHPDLLAHLGAALVSGADAAQAEYLILDEEETTRSRLVAAGFLLFHRVRLGGRAVLGLPAFLVGNGMLFSRRLLTDMPWNAFSGVEDLEYTVNLRLAGYRPLYVPAARVAGPVPHGYRGMRGQRLRWEGGRWHVVRSRLGPLLRQAVSRDPGLLDAAIDLAVPPLGLLTLGVLAGGTMTAVAVALHRAAAWSLSPWLLAVAAILLFVLVGLRSAGAPASTWLALLESPRFLLWKALTYTRLLSGFDPRRWERAERSGRSDQAAPAAVASRVRVAGVPIDRVDMSGALERLRYALVHRRQVQVATVNTDFLVRAQGQPGVRRVLEGCDLNVADGAPVVWLSRLMGRPLPARVAGADLVPRLVAEAAARGAGVFLLGGEGGAAEAAARRLSNELPELRIAGWHEPPRASLDDLNGGSDEIVETIRSSGAQVLLVALGNPKQELWIARHRERLPDVSVAVGVGCVFDLWAGRVRRAPAWMQRAGLEWLHRLLAEPRRLAGRYLKDGVWLLLLSAGALRERWLGAGASRSPAASLWRGR